MPSSPHTPTILTLDAGGTNFVFSAIKDKKEIITPFSLPSHADDLTLCLQTLTDGFQQAKSLVDETPAAISFAFPGPADYPNGIIGDLGNLPCFRGGIALGPMLEDRFGIPVFINNDGDLFAYGEAHAGLLPQINHKLEASGSQRKYRNFFGITLGTGFGGGIVHNGRLYEGDNAAGGEVWLMRNRLFPDSFAEEGASKRAVQRSFAHYLGDEQAASLSPRQIYSMGMGEMGEDGRLPSAEQQDAAKRAYEYLGKVVGDALANAMTLLDGLVVIGGGLAGAWPLFMPALVAEMNQPMESLQGTTVNRLESKVFNLEDENDFALFLKGEATLIKVPGSHREVSYDPMKRMGVGVSRLGTSEAVAVGAYLFAVNKMSR